MYPDLIGVGLQDDSFGEVVNYKVALIFKNDKDGKA
jgi:hypothetical protein